MEQLLLKRMNRSSCEFNVVNTQLQHMIHAITHAFALQL
jgi:hypothetical protein